MDGRMSSVTAAKVKLSITLSRDLVGRIDRVAAGRGATRSAVVERWLRRAERLEAERELEQATVTYYEGLDAVARTDDEELGRGLSRAARRVRPDAGGRKR